jgi:hypothetical protein
MAKRHAVDNGFVASQSRLVRPVNGRWLDRPAGIRQGLGAPKHSPAEIVDALN